jgi:hypothetical protein
MEPKSLKRYAWLSIAAALSTILLKGIAWRLTGSVGLLSDAIESFHTKSRGKHARRLLPPFFARNLACAQMHEHSIRTTTVVSIVSSLPGPYVLDAGPYHHRGY